MELGTIITLGVLAFGAYKINSRNRESEEYKSQLEDAKDKYNDLLKQNEVLINKIDPNKNEHQPDITITGAMKTGGLTYTHNRIILYITNNSSIDVEIGDFKCDLYMAGFKSLLLQPANINQVVIKPGKTVEFTLYAKGGKAISNVGDVKDDYYGLIKSDTYLMDLYMQRGFYIPYEYAPVELDMAFLWFWKGGYEQVRVYNVPCSFEYGGAVWTVGLPWKGYNRASSKAAGSLWNDIEDNEDGEE